MQRTSLGMSCLTLAVLLAGLACRLPAADDVARKAPPLCLQPGPAYADTVRMFQGIPGIERAANGRLWACWYGGGVTEDQNNYVMLATSGDDAKTWSRLKLVIDPDGPGPCRAFDPCLWHDPQGRLWLFWAQRHQSTQLWAIVTGDSGAESPAWSVPRPVAPGIMMNKPLVTAFGAWLLPVANWKRAGSAGVVRTTDGGATWTPIGAATIPRPADRNCDEHLLIERRDHSLWMLVRTGYGIGQSTSADQGATWADVQPWSVPHTVSRFFVRRLQSGKLLLVKHGGIAEKTGRAKLTAFLSDDDGHTWQGGLLLDERNGVSYPDGVQAPDGTIYLIYDYARTRERQILLATFQEADIAAGKCVSPAARLRLVINQATGIRPPDAGKRK